MRYLVVRHLPHTAQCGVHLVASSEAVPGLEEWARAVAALSTEVRTVTLLLNRSRAGVAFGEEERPLVGDGVIVERLLGLEFEATANTFLQTNSRQAESHVVDGEKSVACVLAVDDFDSGPFLLFASPVNYKEITSCKDKFISGP